MQVRIGVSLAILALLSACATDPSTGAKVDTLISVEYGTITKVEQVQLSANHATGALVGGGLGLAAASRRSAETQAGAAVAGALLGALIADSQKKTADRYSVQLRNGANVAIVSEHHDLEVGDCVSVEQGKHANIRRVSAVMCDTARSHPAYSDMNKAYKEESAECAWAKEQLMKADTAEATDVAYKKMRAFCEA
jgi:outer membrane lipoprotein SlyB